VTDTIVREGGVWGGERPGRRKGGGGVEDFELKGKRE